MAESFVQLLRGETTNELLKKPFAFTLLCQIAIRARRTSTGVNVHNLELNQALIGDHTSCGLTQQQYRTAKKQLAKLGFITTKSTSKGTVATLINKEVVDINAELPTSTATIQQQASNKPATTNNNGNKANKLENGTCGQPKLTTGAIHFDEVAEFATRRGFNMQMAEAWYHTTSGGMSDKSGKPLKNWQRSLIGYKNNYKPPKRHNMSRSDFLNALGYEPGSEDEMTANGYWDHMTKRSWTTKNAATNSPEPVIDPVAHFNNWQDSDPYNLEWIVNQ